jgi:hypothetical protein
MPGRLDDLVLVGKGREAEVYAGPPRASTPAPTWPAHSC